MKHTKFSLTLVFMIGFGVMASKAQQGIVSTGGEASGTGGSVQRSTGLTDFRYFFSQEGSIQYGIQQSYQLFTLNLIAEPAAGGNVESKGKYNFGQQVFIKRCCE